MKKIAKLTAFGEDRYEDSDWQDSVPGGKADKKTPMDFDPEKLSEGLKIELEHTDDRKLALEIAMDHLTEDEDYYRKLKKIEKQASWRYAIPGAVLGGAVGSLAAGEDRRLRGALGGAALGGLGSYGAARRSVSNRLKVGEQINRIRDRYYQNLESLVGWDDYQRSRRSEEAFKQGRILSESHTDSLLRKLEEVPFDIDEQLYDAKDQISRRFLDDGMITRLTAPLAGGLITGLAMRKGQPIEKQASVRLLPPRALSGFADEMTKVALPGLGTSLAAAALLGPSQTSVLGKIVRLLATPIPGTPKLFMKVRNKQQLDALETKVREKARDLTNENIAKLLRKLKVDKIFQKLEPVLGSTTAPKAYRDTFGARKVHELAHRPIYSLLGYSPIPYATSVSGAAAGLAEKYLGLAPPRSFKMPGEAAKGVSEAAKDIVQGAAKPSAMQRVKFKIPEAAKVGLVAGVPAAAIAAGNVGKEKTASIKERAGRVLKGLLDEAGEAVTQKAKQQKQELVDELRSAIQGGRGVIDEAIQQSVGKAMGQVAPHLDSLIQRNLHAAQPQIDQALQKATKNLVTEGIARAKAEAAPVLRRLGQQALAGGISGGIGGAVQGNERSDVVRGAALGAALSPLSFGAGRKVSERLLKNRSEGARQLATAGIGSALTGLGLGYGISR